MTWNYWCIRGSLFVIYITLHHVKTNSVCLCSMLSGHPLIWRVAQSFAVLLFDIVNNIVIICRTQKILNISVYSDRLSQVFPIRSTVHWYLIRCTLLNQNAKRSALGSALTTGSQTHRLKFDTLLSCIPSDIWRCISHLGHSVGIWCCSFLDVKVLRFARRIWCRAFEIVIVNTNVSSTYNLWTSPTELFNWICLWNMIASMSDRFSFYLTNVSPGNVPCH